MKKEVVPERQVSYHESEERLTMRSYLDSIQRNVTGDLSVGRTAEEIVAAVKDDLNKFRGAQRTIDDRRHRIEDHNRGIVG